MVWVLRLFILLDDLYLHNMFVSSQLILWRTALEWSQTYAESAGSNVCHMYTLCCPCLHVPVGSRRAMGVRRELLWNELMDCVIGSASGSSIGGSVKEYGTVIAREPRLVLYSPAVSFSDCVGISGIVEDCK